MICPACGTASGADARFCGGCGLEFQLPCGACGAGVGLHQRFCGLCGQPVAPRAAEPSPRADAARPSVAERLGGSLTALDGERKQVTVLFADLKSSLELLADRDPEDARRLLDPVLAIMVSTVRRYGGTVNQVMGDGIMALFGAPVAQEDHALRACHAALDMHAAIAEHANRLRPTLKIRLQIRIGLNSGEVVVRLVDSDVRFEYTAVGRTTHVAARLEQMAEPGTTLMTGTTRRLAEDYVDVRPLGPVAIRGVTAPVEIYELIAMSRVRTRADAARARWTTRLVGRELELASLRRAAERAAAGRTQVVAVVGEAGVGKSRLVSEFTHAGLPAGWAVLETGAVPHAPVTAFVAIVGLVRQYFDVADDDDADAIRHKLTTRIRAIDAEPAHMLPPLLELMGTTADDPAWRDLDPARRRQRTLEALSELVVRHARTQPVCIVVEDVPAVDAETKALLDRLVDRVVTERILLIVTYRPEYAHHWSACGHYTQLSVQPLAPSEAQRLLEQLIGTDPELDDLVALLVDRSEGSPLFLESSVSDLIEAQALSGEPGAYRLKQPVDSVHVPSTVQAMMAARIDRLPPDDRSLLQCAAAIGKEVPISLLSAVAELDEEDARRRLDALRMRGFLYESGLWPVSEFSFSHVLMLEVALGSLVSETRRALNLRILHALERLHAGRLAEHADRLAHHALRGEAWEQAVAYCREAGARAFTRAAHGAAVEHFERALAALGRLPQTPGAIQQAIDVRLDLRAALISLGDFRRTVESLHEAETLARTIGDERRLATVGSHLANYLHLTGRLNAAVEQARHALDIAGRLQDTQLQVVTTAYLAFTEYTLGNYRHTVELARRNVAALQGALERELFGMTSLPAVYSRTCLAWALAELGDFDEAERAGDEALAIAERATHAYSIVYACVAAGLPRFRRGELEAARPLLERGFALCHAHDIRVLLSIVTVPLAACYGGTGRIADALRVLEDTTARARRIHDPIGHWVRTGALAETYALAGRPRDAHPLALQYLQQRRSIGARGYEAWARHLLAEITADLPPPAPEQARGLYLDAMASAEQLGMRPLVGLCRLGLGRLERRSGRVADAKAALRAAAEAFRAMGMRSWLDITEREANLEP